MKYISLCTYSQASLQTSHHSHKQKQQHTKPNQTMSLSISFSRTSKKYREGVSVSLSLSLSICACIFLHAWVVLWWFLFPNFFNFFFFLLASFLFLSLLSTITGAFERQPEHWKQRPELQWHQLCSWRVLSGLSCCWDGSGLELLHGALPCFVFLCIMPWTYPALVCPSLSASLSLSLCFSCWQLTIKCKECWCLWSGLQLHQACSGE